ncbi:hypothetical protein HYZ80_03205 [Candidatus Parcubacteria bacterium]|nr:hypothetical protein [Candidatus Parcubacteria bacterium]
MPTRRGRRVLCSIQPRQGAVSTEAFELVREGAGELLNALGIAPLRNGRERVHAVLCDPGRTMVFVHVWNVDVGALRPAVVAQKLEGTPFQEISSLDGGYSRRFSWQAGPWTLKFILWPSLAPDDLNFSPKYDARWGIFWIGQEVPAPAAR